MATSPASATFDALPAPLLLYTMAETAGFKEGDLVGALSVRIACRVQSKSPKRLSRRAPSMRVH